MLWTSVRSFVTAGLDQQPRTQEARYLKVSGRPGTRDATCPRAGRHTTARADASTARLRRARATAAVGRRIAQTDAAGGSSLGMSTSTASAIHRVSTRPIASASATSAIPIGKRTRRPKRVVRGDPRLRLLGHLLLEDCEPERQMDGDADPADERRRRDHRRRRAQRESERLERDQRCGEDAHDDGRRGRIRIANAADDGADAARGEDRRPRPPRRAARPRPRAEHYPSGEREVPDAEQTTDAQSHVLDVNSCQPSRSSWTKPGDELASRAVTRMRRRRPAHTRKLTASIASATPGLGRRPPLRHGRAEHADHVPRELLEGVRLLEPLGAHDLGHETDLRGKHETEAEAVDGLERDDRRDPTDMAEYGYSRQRLRDPVRATRPRGRGCADPVGQTPPDDDERLDPCLTAKTGRALAERCRARRTSDPRERSPIVVIVVGEEQAEVSLPQRSSRSATGIATAGA